MFTKYGNFLGVKNIHSCPHFYCLKDWFVNIMNSNEIIQITATDRKEAMEAFNRVPVTPIEEILSEYNLKLNSYCSEFGVKKHHCLTVLADELMFDYKTCSDISDKYSFIQRH